MVIISKHISVLGELITLTNGKKLIMLDKYTYYNIGVCPEGGFRWSCTASRDCEAYLKVSENLDIEKLINSHYHKPPKYRKNSAGYYVNLDWFSKKSDE